jgi:hypothetical protein
MITPEIMDAVHTAMRPSMVNFDEERCKPWRAMIHQHVWDAIHDRVPQPQLAAMR